MAVENILKKYKETPEGVRNLLGLSGLIVAIIFIFIIFNNFLVSKSVKIEKSDIEIANAVSAENYDEFISSLPSGKLNFYASKDSYQLTPIEYETVCKNTRIVTQRSIMGGNITDISAQQLYKNNGNKIEKFSVKWDSSLNVCLAEYTIRAMQGTTDTITVVGQAKGFLNTGVDTRVYFIKNF
jgi:hypothetical protein